LGAFLFLDLDAPVDQQNLVPKKTKKKQKNKKKEKKRKKTKRITAERQNGRTAERQNGRTAFVYWSVVDENPNLEPVVAVTLERSVQLLAWLVMMSPKSQLGKSMMPRLLGMLMNTATTLRMSVAR
jgi:hypothetical protein